MVRLCIHRNRCTYFTCEPFVFGPALAIDRTPCLCLWMKFSSGRRSPQGGKGGNSTIWSHVSGPDAAWTAHQPRHTHDSSRPVRTFELLPIDRDPTGPIMVGVITTLDHELGTQRESDQKNLAQRWQRETRGDETATAYPWDNPVERTSFVAQLFAIFLDTERQLAEVVCGVGHGFVVKLEHDSTFTLLAYFHVKLA